MGILKHRGLCGQRRSKGERQRREAGSCELQGGLGLCHGESSVSPQQLPSTSSVVAWSQGEGTCGLLRLLYNVTAAIFESLRVSVIHSTNIPRCRFEIILN